MASHDPMDLDTRSQAFYRDFYTHYKFSSDAWYIKDVNHAVMDASLGFVTTFSHTKNALIAGLTDLQTFGVSERDAGIMQGFEEHVMAYGNEVTLFTWNYYKSRISHAWIARISPYHINDGVGVMIRLNDLSSSSTTYEWFSALTHDVSNELIKQPVLADYKDLNPRNELAPREWQVAWLIINGKSVRWIASHLSIRRQSVEKICKRIYFKLRVFNSEYLIEVGRFYHWTNFIPEEYTSGVTLIRL